MLWKYGLLRNLLLRIHWISTLSPTFLPLECSSLILISPTTLSNHEWPRSWQTNLQRCEGSWESDGAWEERRRWWGVCFLRTQVNCSATLVCVQECWVFKVDGGSQAQHFPWLRAHLVPWHLPLVFAHWLFIGEYTYHLGQQRKTQSQSQIRNGELKFISYAVHDSNLPFRLIGVNAAQLGLALISNLSLLLNMAKRIRFEIAQPITITGWYAQEVL